MRVPYVPLDASVGSAEHVYAAQHPSPLAPSPEPANRLASREIVVTVVMLPTISLSPKSAVFCGTRVLVAPAGTEYPGYLRLSYKRVLRVVPH